MHATASLTTQQLSKFLLIAPCASTLPQELGVATLPARALSLEQLAAALPKSAGLTSLRLSLCGIGPAPGTGARKSNSQLKQLAPLSALRELRLGGGALAGKQAMLPPKSFASCLTLLTISNCPALKLANCLGKFTALKV